MKRNLNKFRAVQLMKKERKKEREKREQQNIKEREEKMIRARVISMGNFEVNLKEQQQ